MQNMLLLSKVTGGTPVGSKLLGGLIAMTHSRCHSANATGAGSVDTDDVQRHARLAADWWNPSGPMRALHSLNSIRVPFIRDGLIATSPAVRPELAQTASALRGLRLLEVGCGAGVLTEALARLQAHVTAIDPGRDVIDAARAHLDAYAPVACGGLPERIDYRCETVEAHAADHPLRYDAVVVSEVLEHVRDKPAFLRACTAAVRPGGSVFVTTFNKTCWSWLGGIVVAEYVAGLVPRGTHDWEQFVTPLETQRMLAELDCDAVLVNGFLYEMWCDRWRWIPSLELSYAVHAVKRGGDAEC